MPAIPSIAPHVRALGCGTSRALLVGGGGNDVIVAHIGDDTLDGDGANEQGGLPDPLQDGDDVIRAFDNVAHI